MPLSWNASRLSLYVQQDGCFSSQEKIQNESGRSLFVVWPPLQSVLDPLLQTSCQHTFLKVLYFQEGRGGGGKGREKDMIRLKHYAHMQLPNTFFCTLKPFHHFLHLLKENSFSFLGVSSFVPLDDGIFT